jgi:hypothetical protein
MVVRGWVCVCHMIVESGLLSLASGVIVYIWRWGQLGCRPLLLLLWHFPTIDYATLTSINGLTEYNYQSRTLHWYHYNCSSTGGVSCRMGE